MAPPTPSDNDDVFAAGERVAVLLPRPLTTAYDYRVPDGLTLATGDIVRVPLGPSAMSGVVWGPGTGEVDDTKLRDVAARHDCPALPAVLRRFVRWVADYTLADAGAVLRMAMSIPEAFEPPAPTSAIALDPDAPDIRLTPARQRVLDAASEGPPRPAAELARQAGCTPGVVAGLVSQGALAKVTMALAPPPLPEHARPGVELADDQAAAAAALVDSAAARDFSVTLLDGVPGAGKTEVYFEAVAEALRQGRQVLVLLPEIALSAQWLERFRRRFGVAPVVWHSELARGQRRQAWRWIAEGVAPVVVGARSALWLPFPDLGLVIVDEEHDASFKQEDGVIYNARDMAVVRARLGAFAAVLVSATPSLETVANVGRGRYGHLALAARHGGAALPDIAVIDVKAEPPPRGQWIAPKLRQALEECFQAGDQAMLFLNRRGYAPLTLCRTCGHRFQCPTCSAWLVEHRLLGRLQCHHCGHRVRPPKACPECETEDSLAACGPGVERLAEEAAALFPDQRLLVAASDTVTGPKAAADLVRRIEDREVDLLIGTQIVAKGYHFPHLTLVGVVDADLGLSGGDLRAAERTYQLLYQVAGRAGRAERPGRVMLQTYMPEHPVMAALASGDRDAFTEAEQLAREVAGMPPHGRLAALVVSGKDEAAVDQAARELGRTAPRPDGVHVWGPAPAPLALLRGRHRRRLLMRTQRHIAPQPLLREWIQRARLPKKVRVQIDVDPYSFL